MITLNDYLYSGDTLLRILHNYSGDLRKDARKSRNEIDLAQLTHAEHPLKFRTVIRFHAAETLVGKNVDQIPFLILCNVFRINTFLRCKGISLICGV